MTIKEMADNAELVKVMTRIFRIYSKRESSEQGRIIGDLEDIIRKYSFEKVDKEKKP